MDATLIPDSLHRLVLLYLAVGYGADQDFDLHERQTVSTLICRWQPGLSDEAAAGVVDTAYAAAQAGLADDLDALARSVGADLSPTLRRRVLSDLGRVALADGHLSVSEGHLIARVRAAWDEA